MVLNMKDQSIRLGNIQTKFINDLDISKAGKIYFTDSSSRYEFDLILTQNILINVPTCYHNILINIY